MADRKPILCIDFDGVLHSYTSGWRGADVCPDRATPGAMEFLFEAAEAFRISIFSSRSLQPLGIEAMQLWLRSQLYKHTDRETSDELFAKIEWPREKPPAMVTIDDRAVCFTGKWPKIEDLREFKTWQQAPLTVAPDLEVSRLRRELMHAHAELARQDNHPRLLTTDNAQVALWYAIRNIRIGSPTDDKLILIELEKLGYWIASIPTAPQANLTGLAIDRVVEACGFVAPNAPPLGAGT